MHINELDRNQQMHQGKEITVAGIVRATYDKPFPYFLIEDATGTLICRPKLSLPWPGAHIEITGRFEVTIPENCTVQLAILRENERTYIPHDRYTCELPGCEFAALPDAATLNSIWL